MLLAVSLKKLDSARLPHTLSTAEEPSSALMRTAFCCRPGKCPRGVFVAFALVAQILAGGADLDGVANVLALVHARTAGGVSEATWTLVPWQRENNFMFESTAARSAEFADRFEAAQDEFIRLIESLGGEQCQPVGKNYPQRVNDEDERRTVGVIAHHVATSGPFILERIQLMAAGKSLPPVGDFRELNARHAAENAGVTRDEVLSVLRETKGQIAAAVRAIPDDQLDQQRETPAGPMSVAQRLDRVFLKMHQGSIEVALAR